MNAAQTKVIEVLSDLGGWSCHAALLRHGASTASAKGLAAKGLIDERSCESTKGYAFSEWRIPKVTNQQIISFLDEHIAGSSEEDFISVARFADRSCANGAPTDAPISQK